MPAAACGSSWRDGRRCRWTVGPLRVLFCGSGPAGQLPAPPVKDGCDRDVVPALPRGRGRALGGAGSERGRTATGGPRAVPASTGLTTWACPRQQGIRPHPQQGGLEGSLPGGSVWRQREASGLSRRWAGWRWGRALRVCTLTDPRVSLGPPVSRAAGHSMPPGSVAGGTGAAGTSGPSGLGCRASCPSPVALMAP